MSWEEEFKKKIVTPEEAISHVKNGDRVCFVQGNEPQALGLALAARFGELENVTISVRTPGRDFGWYDPGMGSFVCHRNRFSSSDCPANDCRKKMRY